MEHLNSRVGRIVIKHPIIAASLTIVVVSLFFICNGWSLLQSLIPGFAASGLWVTLYVLVLGPAQNRASALNLDNEREDSDSRWR